VRCNERRPRCAHCERLNLDCTWNRPSASRSSSVQTSNSVSNAGLQASSHQQIFNPNLLALDGFAMGSHAFFDFSGPLGAGTWDEAMLLSPNSWPSDHQMEGAQQPLYQLPLGHQSSGSLVEAPLRTVQSIPDRAAQRPEPELVSTSPFSAENAPNGTMDEDFLLKTFLQMLMPPILTPVEPKWASTRAFFGAMAGESIIVRSAIMAFAAMQMQRSGLGGDVVKKDWRTLYESAARNLSSALPKKRKEEETDSAKIGLKYILASLFLLTYTDVSLCIISCSMCYHTKTCILHDDFKSPTPQSILLTARKSCSPKRFPGRTPT
jgi:hypothetical protein